MNRSHLIDQQCPHALEHMGGRQCQIHRMQPLRQRFQRIINATKRQQEKVETPGEVFNSKAVTHQKSAHQQPDCPARRHQIEEEGDQHQPHVIGIEAEEHDHQHAHRYHANQHPQYGDQHQRCGQFGGPQRVDYQMADIARPHLLQKGHRKPDLAPEKNIPQQH